MYYATSEDIERSKKVIAFEMNKFGLYVTDDELNGYVEDIMNKSYSIGGGYDEDTIRKITQALLEKGYLRGEK